MAASFTRARFGRKGCQQWLSYPTGLDRLGRLFSKIDIFLTNAWAQCSLYVPPAANGRRAGFARPPGRSR